MILSKYIEGLREASLGQLWTGVRIGPRTLRRMSNKAAQLEERVQELEKFVYLVQTEWITLESAESEGVVRVEYPTDVHKNLKALGG